MTRRALQNRGLQSRISDLLRHGPPSLPQAPDEGVAGTNASAVAMTVLAPPDCPPGASLEDILAGTVRHTELGEYYHLGQPARRHLSGADELAARLRALTTAVPSTPPFEHSTAGRLSHDWHHLRNPPAEQWLFFDIETTGLASRPLFLIGTLRLDSDGMRIDQYFARTYVEEAALLTSFLVHATARPVWISFNGKTFDYPYVRDRCNFFGLPLLAPALHFDMLPHARRRWRAELPDCRLQTLETHFLRRRRVDDVPGDRIPDAYHDYVESGNPTEIVRVVHHNLLDLLAMAELLPLLAE